jgi:AcrR family transcriptional regulator
MARPKSEDKRTAILEAAVTEFASRGSWSTPTAAISKAAQVAEGTLFTYFATKGVLVNELYRTLKQELADAMMIGYPGEADIRSKLKHVWNTFVRWGVANPARYKVMMQLRVSDQLTDESKAFGAAAFCELEQLAKDAIKAKLIKNYPVEYIGAMFGSLAETTMSFVATAKSGRHDYCADGFDVFWRGVSAD